MPPVLPASPLGLIPGSNEPGTLALPAQLKIKRYCHGEWRLSLYPTSTGKRKRYPLVGRAIESLSIPDKAPCVGRHRPPAPPVKVTKQLAIEYSGLLDYRSEVQGISFKRGRIWHLPTRKYFRQSGRIRVMESASIATRLYGKNAIFCTMTIPGSGWRIAAAIAGSSGKIINRVKQWFRDNLKGTYSYFSVWEWQKRGMLHLHCCVASNDVENLETLRKGLKQRWITLLQDISWDCKIDVFRKNLNWTWQDDLETCQMEAVWVTKSIVRYIAKYASKCVNTRTRPKFFCPTRWWSTDRETARVARLERVEILLRGFTGAVGMSVLTSLVEAFRASEAAMITFRNFCWQAYGGINLFEKGDGTMPLITQMVADNYSQFSI